jgi:anti-sigma regulatory factor (Ser/Thr protein kinase)
MALEQWFDADTLSDLRGAVLAEAVAAGLPDDQAANIMLAVHELAANAVLHGSGAGRLRMHAVASELICHITEDGHGGAGGRARAGSVTAVQQWLTQPGHGLWLVREIADHLSITPSPAGSQVTAVFALPSLFGGEGNG